VDAADAGGVRLRSGAASNAIRSLYRCLHLPLQDGWFWAWACLCVLASSVPHGLYYLPFTLRTVYLRRSYARSVACLRPYFIMFYPYMLRGTVDVLGRWCATRRTHLPFCTCGDIHTFDARTRDARIPFCAALNATWRGSTFNNTTPRSFFGVAQRCTCGATLFRGRRRFAFAMAAAANWAATRFRGMPLLDATPRSHVVHSAASIAVAGVQLSTLAGFLVACWWAFGCWRHLLLLCQAFAFSCLTCSVVPLTRYGLVFMPLFFYGRWLLSIFFLFGGTP